MLRSDSTDTKLIDERFALTKRSWGARLITTNRADFELIRDCWEFELEVW
jgi:hypothetical protein